MKPRLLACIAALALVLTGCTSPAVRTLPPSEIDRLLALPDAKEAAVHAPIFTREVLTVVSRLQKERDLAK